MAFRLPRGISMVTRVRSSCPSCGGRLTAVDLVPLFSYIFLGGKCRQCRAPIGWHYPAIELATVLLCLAFYARFGLFLQVLPLLLLAPVMTAMADIDFRFKIIPDGLNLSVALLALLGFGLGAALSAYPQAYIGDTGLAMAGGALLYGLGAWFLRGLFLWRMRREALGLGDVKFFAAAGLWFGPDPAQLAIFLMVSGVAGIVLALFWHRLTKERAFPFGPALLLAFLAVLFCKGALFLDI